MKLDSTTTRQSSLAAINRCNGSQPYQGISSLHSEDAMGTPLLLNKHSLHKVDLERPHYIQENLCTQTTPTELGRCDGTPLQPGRKPSSVSPLSKCNGNLLHPGKPSRTQKMQPSPDKLSTIIVLSKCGGTLLLRYPGKPITLTTEDTMGLLYKSSNHKLKIKWDSNTTR